MVAACGALEIMVAKFAVFRQLVQHLVSVHLALEDTCRLHGDLDFTHSGLFSALVRFEDIDRA